MHRPFCQQGQDGGADVAAPSAAATAGARAPSASPAARGRAEAVEAFRPVVVGRSAAVRVGVEHVVCSFLIYRDALTIYR